MKLVRYDRNGALRLGIIDGEDLIDLLDACPTGTPPAVITAMSDMTRFIADALAELDEEEARQKFFALKNGSYQQPVDEKHFMEMWLMIKDLQVFFEAAADNMEAVVFLAKYEQ